MKIEAGTVRPDILDVAGKDKAARTERDATGASEQATVEGGRNEVDLSARLRQIRQLAGEIRDIGAVDQERVADLRARIEAGAFTPSSDAIARAMFGEISTKEV